ncbi:tail fiber assembly protein [Phytobacter diazotrophicus]
MDAERATTEDSSALSKWRKCLIILMLVDTSKTSEIYWHKKSTY